MPMRHNTSRDQFPELHARVDAKLDAFIEDFYRDVPFARHFLDSGSVDMGYYKRHTIETILRIRRKRTVDAHIIRYFTLHDPRRAKIWANYTDDEMLHDRLFMADLEKVGLTVEEVYGTDPLLATKLLNGYFLYYLEYEDSPMAGIASSYFLEYTTRKTQPDWLENLEKQMGREKVKGAWAHVNQDIEEDHTDVVWNTLTSLINGPEDEARLLKHMDELYELFTMYFREVHKVVAPAPSPVPVGAAGGQGA
ncbi:iron-containing redox enzyme family protein [Streptomyces sp. NPDC003233]